MRQVRKEEGEALKNDLGLSSFTETSGLEYEHMNSFFDKIKKDMVVILGKKK
jgi:hypothetical protein